jgi:transcriptional regulator with XRE-family HTH domain
VKTHTTTLADRLVEARNAKDLTTAQLARRVGVKTGTLRNWETGASEPRPNRLAMLAGVLDVSISWLLEGSPIYRPSHISATRADMIAHKLERARAIQDDLAQLMVEIADEVDALRREEAMEDELAA